MSFGVAQRTSAGNTVFPIESCLYEKRIVWVEGDIDAEAANNFIKQIVWLNQQNKSEAIKVMISSNGGSVVHGLAMYDAIQTSQAPVETYCIGTAYSMGAVLFAAGKKRYILEHSKVMLHEPLIGSGVGGSASSVKAMSDSLQSTKQQLNKILCKHTGKTQKQMEKVTNHDHYFSAKEAVDFGLADEIVGLQQLF